MDDRIKINENSGVINKAYKTIFLTKDFYGEFHRTKKQ